MKGGRWALLKNPPNLTGDQRTTLASIATANGALYRAYLRVVQWPFPRRVPHHRAVRHPAGGTGTGRRLAHRIQHRKTPRLARRAHPNRLTGAEDQPTSTHNRWTTKRGPVSMAAPLDDAASTAILHHAQR